MIRTLTRRALLGAALTVATSLALAPLVTPTAQAADRFITVASTTSTQNSGLFGFILPKFQAATGIEVRVVGTIFTVTVDEEASRVGVQVERGLVEVDNGARVAELGPGDSLGLDIEDELVLVDPDPLPSRPAARPTAPSIETLLADADAARARGDLSRAASALGELVRRHPKDPRAYSAHFQLGKVERARGRHAAAAAAFVRCWKHSPRGALAEDARAESAVSWKAAGRADRARTAAEEYLRHHPSGTHRARMQALLAELP